MVCFIIFTLSLPHFNLGTKYTPFDHGSYNNTRTEDLRSKQSFLTEIYKYESIY